MGWGLIYLFTVSDQIREAVAAYGGALILAMVITVVFALLTAACWTEAPKEATWDSFSKNGLFKWARRVVYIFWAIPIFMWTVHTFLPTQKNLAIMIGAGVTYEAVTSDAGKRIGGKLIQMLEDKMDNALHEGGSGGEVKEQAKEEQKPEAEKPSAEESRGKVHGQSA